MPFLPCYLCDALRGAEPCRVLIENRACFAVHAPPHDCVPRLVLVAPKRHVTGNRLPTGEGVLLIALQQTIAQTLREITDGGTVERRCEPARFGHLCWMVWPATDPLAPRTGVLGALGAYPQPEVLRWSREVETALDPARILAAGDRLPPPPLLPGARPRDTLRISEGRSCSGCGARLRHNARFCHGCGRPLAAEE